MTKNFENHLRKLNLADNTIASYSFAVRQFYSHHQSVTQKNLRTHKTWLIDHYKPKTVNLRIRALNMKNGNSPPFEFSKKRFLKMLSVKLIMNILRHV